MAGALGPVLGGAAALGGLAYTLSKGESPLPSEFTTVAGYAPSQVQTGKDLVTSGQALSAEATPFLQTGATGFQMAEQGQLTPEQQAALTQTGNLEKSQAVQMYASMGRNAAKDTSFINTSATIDTNLTAMAQSFIQSTIDLASKAFAAGGSLLSAGASMVGEGLAFEQASASNLIAAGNAQMKLDEDYSNAISQAFGNIAKAFSGGGFGGGSGGSSSQQQSPIGWSPAIGG